MKLTEVKDMERRKTDVSEKILLDKGEIDEIIKYLHTTNDALELNDDLKEYLEIKDEKHVDPEAYERILQLL